MPGEEEAGSFGGLGLAWDTPLHHQSRFFMLIQV